jgi:hypothetical protein
MINIGGGIVKVVKSRAFWKGASLVVSLVSLAVGGKSHELEQAQLKDELKKEILEELAKAKD